VSHNCDGPLGEHNALIACLIGIELPDIAVPLRKYCTVCSLRDLARTATK
jgi:hypothetical protein